MTVLYRSTELPVNIYCLQYWLALALDCLSINDTGCTVFVVGVAGHCVGRLDDSDVVDGRCIVLLLSDVVSYNGVVSDEVVG